MIYPLDTWHKTEFLKPSAFPDISVWNYIVFPDLNLKCIIFSLASQTNTKQVDFPSLKNTRHQILENNIFFHENYVQTSKNTNMKKINSKSHTKQEPKTTKTVLWLITKMSILFVELTENFTTIALFFLKILKI